VRVAQSKTKTIGEYEYIVTPLPSEESTEVLRRLSGVLGNGVSKLAGDSDGIAAIGGLFSSITKEDKDYLLSVFVKQTWVKQGDRKLPLESCFNEHFRGFMDEQMQWVTFCMELNFTSFFLWLRGLLSASGLASKMPFVSNSRKASTP
jgi:hypothetical protein